MEKKFISYLNTIDNFQELSGQTFDKFVSNTESFIKYVKRKSRKPIREILSICIRLRALGAPIESHKIMKADAKYYRKKGMEKEYWINLYYSFAFANLAYPTKSIEKNLKKSIEVLKRDKFPEFIPLFLNAYGNILHIYRKDLKNAKFLYEEAINRLNQINPDRFQDITTKGWDWTYKLLVSNLTDLLLYKKRDNKEEKQLDRLYEILRKSPNATPYIKLLSDLNQVEIFIAREKLKKAEKLINHIVEDTPEKLNRYTIPSVSRLRGLLEARRGNIQKAIKASLTAFGHSTYFGNTLDEKFAIKFLLKTFSLIAKEVPWNRKIDFFEENNLFDVLVEILRLKDWYLGEEHSKSVSKISYKIASSLGMDEQKKKIVKYGGLLHDIGKIMVPWYTLNKTLQLDALDWEIIQAHTVEGYKILNTLGLKEEAEIARDHHERIDGRGYPSGKRNIQLSTEIVAVADVYDASITPNRRYKIFKMPEDAIREIRTGVRGKFSNKVINGLISVLF